MTAGHRICLFAATVAVLIVAECWRLGRIVGGAYQEYREMVTW